MFRIMSKSAKSAEVLIYGDIGSSFWGDGVTAADFAKLLNEIGDVEEIVVRVNSYGGDVADGLAIYRQLVENKAKITIMIDGFAVSAASFICMAGDKIVMAQAARVMIHDALTLALGNAEDMRRTADALDDTSQQLAEIYAARTGKTPTEIRDLMRDETWFTASEAVVFGLVDEIAPNKTKEKADNKLDNVVALDLSKHKFRKTPADLLPGRSSIAAMVAQQQVAITTSRAALKRA